jgi:hypothetical protein
MLNNLTFFLNAVPGNRVFFYVLTNFMITFDRLQLYYFHRQNLTYYSEALLSNADTLVTERGSYLQMLFQSC